MGIFDSFKNFYNKAKDIYKKIKEYKPATKILDSSLY